MIIYKCLQKIILKSLAEYFLGSFKMYILFFQNTLVYKNSTRT